MNTETSAPSARTDRLGRWLARCASPAGWAVLPLVGVIWLISRYSAHWYFRDEWAMIRSTVEDDLVEGMFDGFLGHLFAISHLVYRIQIRWLDAESHEFVYLVFVVSVVVVQLSASAVFRCLGASRLVAVTAGSLLAYFGPGAEGFTFQFQLSQNFAVATVCASIVVILRTARPRSPGALHVGGVALLLVASVAADSGLAIIGLVTVTIVAVALWPRRRALLAMVPPAVANGAWLLFGEETIHLQTSASRYRSFAWHLMYESTAGFSGFSGPAAGIVVIAVANAIALYGLWTRRLSRQVLAVFLGGVVGGCACVAAITWSRAYLVPADELVGRNYVFYVAFFFGLGYVPALVATIGSIATDERWGLQPISRSVIAASALALIFFLGTDTTRRGMWNDDTVSAISREEVRQAATLIFYQCAGFGELVPRGQPSPAVSPDLTVDVLQYLQDRGKISPAFAAMPTTVMVERLCTNPP